MNRLKGFILTGFVILFFCGNLFSQSMNNVIVWASGGYASLLSSDQSLSSRFGLGGGLGVGYEFQYKKFIMHTGAEFIHSKPVFVMDYFRHRQEGLIDSEGESYTGHFAFSENEDKYTLGTVNVPLMFGVQTGRFYFMLGAKLWLNVLASSSVSSVVQSTGVYDFYIDPFKDMPNHNFDTKEVRNDFPVNLDLNCSASVELGVHFGSKEKESNLRYRFSVFADYGLLNVNGMAKEELPLQHVNAPIYQPYLNNFMRATAALVNTLYAGIKLTFLFGIEDKYDCMCDAYAKPKRRR